MLKNKLPGLLAGLVLCLFAFQQVSAKNKDGYKIQLKFTDIRDTQVFLAHYFGKSLPTIYKTDSARIDKNGMCVMQSREKILSGIYIILLSDKKTYFDFLLQNGDDITITATAQNLPYGIKYTGSQQNSDFTEYGNFLSKFGRAQQQLSDELSRAKTSADTAAVSAKFKASAKELYDYRKSYMKTHPGTLLASIFGALLLPQVPEGTHYLPDGTMDSAFAYNYYKKHYWDDFNLQDDRLIYTPIYDAKLDEYMNKLVLQYEDSVIKEGEWLLSKTKGTEELFKYTLWWLTNNAGQSKIMGMDAVYVHFVENYYMKGYATWLKPEDLQQYITTARKIAPNVIGNVAPEVKLRDLSGKVQSLHAVKSKYTLLVFWSPDCGHCQEEIPRLDSIYKAALKNKGVKIYAVSTLNDDKMLTDFIKKHHLEEWIHVWDPENTSRFRDDYNVYMTPILYLLDDKKIIKGKRLDYSNIAGLIDMLERKKTAQNNN